MIRSAVATDIAAIVDLSERKRVQYEAYQPLFWRKAEDSRAKQAGFLQHLLARENVFALVYEREGTVDGFLVATLVPSPPVYAAGLTCAVDDYWVAGQDWEGVGRALLDAAVQVARERGAVQCVVVCGHLDASKRLMLEGAGHSIASEWWVRPL